MEASHEKSLVDKLLPLELTNGNDGRGSRWFNSAKRRKAIEDDLRLLGLARQPFGHPVRIEITRILGKGQRFWDEDSIGRGNAKELVDALVAIGWFRDDSRKWITQCDYRQDAGHRKRGPAIRIRVFAE